MHLGLTPPGYTKPPLREGTRRGGSTRHRALAWAPGSCHCMADMFDLRLKKYATDSIPLNACPAWVCLPLNVTARGVVAVASPS